jgi:hypothetical protein
LGYLASVRFVLFGLALWAAGANFGVLTKYPDYRVMSQAELSGADPEYSGAYQQIAPEHRYQ